MRMGISVPIFSEFADVRALADLAASAEAAGWDGFFLWDHLVWPWADEIVDAWIALTAIALRTERIRIGPLVTPLPRRRPAKVARETVTLDRLSGGRLIFGAGAGEFPAEFADLGEAGDAATRAAMLDEALQVVTGLWSGETVRFSGAYYQVREARFRPPALQQPRIPVWIGGQWPRPGPLARAARWDGYVPIKVDLGAITPDDVAAMARRLDLAARPGFDLVVFGSEELIPEFAAAGATWWLDGPTPWDLSLPAMQRRITAGPPDGG
jgi:alkanesulfonate monooxygenase SsuD/methylene tetrahydromethanopterin reductase-like flavin-dependent oxidoreductase (luciferase family)